MVLKQQKFLTRPWKCCVPADTFKCEGSRDKYEGKRCPILYGGVAYVGRRIRFLSGNFGGHILIACLLSVCWWMGAGFLIRILWCSQSGNHLKNNLAKFGLPTRYESRKEMESFYILGYQPCELIIKIWRLENKSLNLETLSNFFHENSFVISRNHIFQVKIWRKHWVIMRVQYQDH